MFDRVRPLVPKPVWILVRRGVAFVRRVKTWGLIMIQVRGATPTDRSSIRFAAVRGLWSSVFNLDEWLDPILLSDALVVVGGVGRFHVRARTDDFYHVMPGREPAILAYISKNLARGDTFVDAGANIGFYTVLAAQRVGDEGRVVAVEMMPDTAEILRHHIVLNQLRNVDIVERALAAQAGLHLIATVPDGKFGQASISREIAETGASRRSTVETTTLAEVINSVGNRVSLLKMDLEGAEYLALQGAGQALHQVKAIIFEELGSDGRARTLLTEAGFRVRRLDGNNFLAEQINHPPMASEAA